MLSLALAILRLEILPPIPLAAAGISALGLAQRARQDRAQALLGQTAGVLIDRNWSPYPIRRELWVLCHKFLASGQGRGIPTR